MPALEPISSIAERMGVYWEHKTRMQKSSVHKTTYTYNVYSTKRNSDVMGLGYMHEILGEIGPEVVLPHA